MAAIEGEQLTAMAAGLRTSLAEAQEPKAEKVAKWRKFIDREYPQLAAGLALEAEAARAVLVRASDHCLGAPFAEPLPRVDFFGLSEPYRRRADLPRTTVQAEAKWEPVASAPLMMSFG